MSTKTTNLHCGKCENGIVQLKVKSINKGYDIKTVACTHCKHHYGIKEIAGLREVSK